MHSDKIFAHYSHSSSDQQTPLHELSFRLYQDQQKRWPMLADGVAALQNVQFKNVECGTYSARLQFNPKRIVSTGAKVDAATIKERKCFLCVGNLPPEQQGVLYQEKFIILCNPMPIFREHFTISHIDHIPQSIEEQILTFLSLAKDLSPVYSVFYNGPKCGASAPDHMHFQGSPAGLIPVEHEIDHFLRPVKKIKDVNVSVTENYGRSVIVLDGSDMQQMELAFLRLTSAMRSVLNTNEEPMMNVIGSYNNNSWRIIVFVRSKHRPAVYFNEGDAKVLISPASVDIGGLIVTPMEKDFRSVDGAMVNSIYNEVSVPQEIISSIIGKL
ncbi:MAG: DUF4922 domain-containing protein [Bacteroidota bacterium]